MQRVLRGTVGPQSSSIANMLVLFAVHCSSWWGHAHMMIGKIGESYLSSKQLQKFSKALDYGQLPRQSIAQASTWQDDLKDAYKLTVMGNWHFADGVLRGEPFTNVKLPLPTYNVSTYLDSAWRTVSDPSTKSLWAWAFALRNIIHFVGDIHTPHHNCALFSDLFPTGDYGGNKYKLNCNYGSACSNIHFLWDAVGMYCPLYNPMIPMYIKEFEENITKLKKEIPENTISDLDVYSPAKWNLESFNDASKYGYSTPMDQWPNESYFKIVQTVGKRRVAAAGYRLGHILVKLADKIPVDDSVNVREIVVWTLNSILFVTAIVFMVLNAKRSGFYSQLANLN